MGTETPIDVLLTDKLVSRGGFLTASGSKWRMLHEHSQHEETEKIVKSQTFKNFLFEKCILIVEFTNCLD